MHYIECNNLTDCADEVLQCLSFWWNTDNEVDRTRDGTDRKKRWMQKKAEERPKLNPFICMRASVLAVRSNCSISPLVLCCIVLV